MDGLVLVDKPAGWTSHDVVAKVRRWAGTRRVGHAGTLDPMATGLLILGVDKATRLLGHLTLDDKTYEATIRLGVATTTDDAEGQVTTTSTTDSVTDEDIRATLNAMVGVIDQVPSSVSAIKINGERAYAKVRAGEEVKLAPRRITIHSIDIHDITRGEHLDIKVTVKCSSGTYIRAIARDLGSALNVGGHLTALRRTQAGHYSIDQAKPLAELENALTIIPIADAARMAFTARELNDEETKWLSHGGALGPNGDVGTVAAFAPDGRLIALLEEREGGARPSAVFV